MVAIFLSVLAYINLRPQQCVNRTDGCLIFFSFWTEPLVFLEPPQVVIQGYLGQNVIVNCTTNDQDAKVSLLHRRHPFASFTERKPKAYKLWKKRQVFRILNIDVRDAGMYSCAATDRAHQSIHWPRFTGYLILSQGRLEKSFYS